ncbi:MAG: hypothetical protein LBK63_04015 [Treponema sp.]|jgi:hypothetical protein|nr:hypothetical protein [Treponema sp.]
MRKKFRLIWISVIGVFGVIIALSYAGCDGVGGGEGEFENQTRYSISVTIVGSSFGIWSESSNEFVPSSSSSFTIYPRNSVRIQSTSDSTINFKWSGGYEANRKTYVVNSGSKVTFKEE